MIKEIIINSSASQTRIAITEDGNLTDFFVDYPESRRSVGDIYFGKVARVLPGIKAAFINIGLKHDAFLHFSDIGDKTKELQALLDEDSTIEDEDEEIVNSNQKNDSQIKTPELINGIPVLKKGQEILVQITKEPVDNKGVRVSSSISIAGRFCVLLPMENRIGISKKINDFKERKRLKHIARSIIPPNFGLIIRTVAKNQPEEILAEDLKLLLKTWNKIQQNIKNVEPPALVHQDLNTTLSIFRDLFSPDVTKVFVDSKKLFKQIKDYVELVQPDLANRIEFYKSSEPIFSAFKIDEQIKTLFGRKVYLKSGGYLIIDHTEAMVVIDVNSGKYAASKEQEQNSLKTDLEASREIARQLRLRDIGGLIVVDFIDLENEENRKKVYMELKKEFKKDRAKVSLLPMSDFGLVEITRQRIRHNIIQSLFEACPYCGGSGLLTRKSHVLYDIEEWIKRFKNISNQKSIIIKCHPSTAEKLKEGFFNPLVKLQLKYLMKIKIKEDSTFHVEQLKFYNSKDEKEIILE